MMGITSFTVGVCGRGGKGKNYNVAAQAIKKSRIFLNLIGYNYYNTEDPSGLVVSLT